MAGTRTTTKTTTRRRRRSTAKTERAPSKPKATARQRNAPTTQCSTPTRQARTPTRKRRTPTRQSKIQSPTPARKRKSPVRQCRKTPKRRRQKRRSPASTTQSQSQSQSQSQERPIWVRFLPKHPALDLHTKDSHVHPMANEAATEKSLLTYHPQQVRSMQDLASRIAEVHESNAVARSISTQRWNLFVEREKEGRRLRSCVSEAVVLDRVSNVEEIRPWDVVFVQQREEGDATEDEDDEETVENDCNNKDGTADMDYDDETSIEDVTDVYQAAMEAERQKLIQEAEVVGDGDINVDPPGSSVATRSSVRRAQDSEDDILYVGEAPPSPSNRRKNVWGGFLSSCTRRFWT